MKYLELVSSFILWVLAILWFKNSTDSGFPYEPTCLIVGGVFPLVDALRRFDIFTTVRLSVQSSEIHPWSFLGGKVEKADIRVELSVENNKEKDLIIRSIEISSPIPMTDILGDCQKRVRLVDMVAPHNDVLLPINISGKSSKTILVESKYDASNIEKYTQASKIGNLNQTELFRLDVTYSIGSNEKKAFTNFSADTSELVTIVRSKYEQSNDYKGVKLIERIQ